MLTSGKSLLEYMLAKSFVVAMAADIIRSNYAKPTLIRSRSREWPIACRWGPDGEYLSIATTGAMLDFRGLAAPDAIAPIHSLFGVLIAESETEAASTFLLITPITRRNGACRHFLSGRWLCPAGTTRDSQPRLQDPLLA